MQVHAMYDGTLMRVKYTASATPCDCGPGTPTEWEVDSASREITEVEVFGHDIPVADLSPRLRAALIEYAGELEWA